MSAGNGNGATPSPQDPSALANLFIHRDDDVKRFAQEIKPVRKQRQDLYKHLLQLLEQEEDPARQVIAVPEGGAVLRLKAVESAAPMKTEFLAEQLVSLLRMSPEQAADVVQRIDEARPRVVRYRIVREKDGTAAAGGTGGGSGREGASRKRGRKGGE
jgi:hypothetical protein